MKNRLVTYIACVVCSVCFLMMGSGDAYGQRARKHRDGALSADSIKARHVADSLALLDTVHAERPQQIIDLEAPVDTARLVAQSDSLQRKDMVEKTRKNWVPESNKSIWLSLAIPGFGQIYNRKYWKLPIIYGGFVGCAYALTWNGKMYKDYSQAYQDIMSDNPNNDSYMDFMPPAMTKEQVQARLSYYQNLFKNRKDVYRRQRDLSIFAFIGVYLLSVIDAYVDAELSDFDITKDLSMTLEPAIFNDAYRRLPQGIGLQCSIKF